MAMNHVVAGAGPGTGRLHADTAVGIFAGDERTVPATASEGRGGANANLVPASPVPIAWRLTVNKNNAASCIAQQYSSILGI
jgi:hypothetical protein